MMKIIGHRPYLMQLRTDLHYIAPHVLHSSSSLPHSLVIPYLSLQCTFVLCTVHCRLRYYRLLFYYSIGSLCAAAGTSWNGLEQAGTNLPY